jgi:hypothetical protein
LDDAAEHFTKLHGIGEPILSGSAGLQEAINLQNAGVSGLGSGGGLVDIDAVWSLYGGTNAIIAAAAAFSNVTIDDNRVGGGPPYWTMQPSTLTNLAVPAVLTTASVFSTTLPTGQAATWTAAAVYTCITYVDALGGDLYRSRGFHRRSRLARICRRDLCRRVPAADDRRRVGLRHDLWHHGYLGERRPVHQREHRSRWTDHHQCRGLHRFEHHVRDYPCADRNRGHASHRRPLLGTRHLHRALDSGIRGPGVRHDRYGDV